MGLLNINANVIGANKGTLLNQNKLVTTFNMAIDGHSYIAPVAVTPPSYLGSILPYSVNTVGSVYNGAIGGTNLDHLLENASTVDSKLITETTTTKNILVIYSMNVVDTEGSGLSMYNLYKAYLVARASAGWKVFVFTLANGLKSTKTDQWDIEKDVFNNLLRYDLTLTKNCYCLDTETISESLNKSNATYFYDGVHPTEWLGYLFKELFVSKIKLVYSDKAIPVPSVPLDGNTVAWYDSQDLTTITKDTSNKVSKWADKLLSGHDLIQAMSAKQPIWSESGILFDGVDDYLKTLAFTYAQPEMIYIVVQQVSWTLTDKLMDGYGTDSGSLSQSSVTPSLRIYASGSESTDNKNLAVGKFGILRVTFNGALGSIKIDISNTIKASAGTISMGGITLGARGAGTANYANIQVKEVIYRNVVDSVKDEMSIYMYLKNKYSL